MVKQELHQLNFLKIIKKQKNTTSLLCNYFHQYCDIDKQVHFEKSMKLIKSILNEFLWKDTEIHWTFLMLSTIMRAN